MDPAIIESLPGPSKSYSIPSLAFSASSFGTAVPIAQNGKNVFFLKTSSSETLIKGEYSALQLISSALPGFCPDPIAIGRCANDSSKFFLVASFLNDLSSGSGKVYEQKLADRLAALHTSSTSEVYGRADATVTCCGSTELPNTPTSTWVEFFSTHRLQNILHQNERMNGKDAEMSRLGEKIVATVVPRLLSRVNSKPSLIHGDLWRGNAGAIKDPGTGEIMPVIYDSCAYYADSEFELGIMRMFGGFSSTGFFQRYHQHVPVKEPQDEYEDRIRLYRLFHELNHSVLFGGGGYAEQAKSSMRVLITKYGT
ncbi:Fructosamine/Ketosamine-3-kinase [Kockiozyma suomiensis]|uniref:Fructosamine/Ketosamine-3-kinase n=1 Tax=Kockiozyma suomiensis TaxID=1337062 RepID=UPI00334334D1